MMSDRNLFFFICCLAFCIPFSNIDASPADDEIAKWADKFGDELWDLGKRMTKSPQIVAKYKDYNARVEEKDGTTLLNSTMANLGRMLFRKMDAIKCIQIKAEEVADRFEYNETLALAEFTYYSSKYSVYNGHRSEAIPEALNDFIYMYKNFRLNQDTHFYNISVNTSYSSVHVPSNIFDRSEEVLRAIIWSEELDEIFRQNYNSDPALSWQYFGSDTGIFRHYPALQWETGGKTDTYDCRKRSWYIETATCSKDIVILLDNSGSMFGFRNHVAKFTIRSILDTFSNNDFFTIYSYSKKVKDLIPCFKDVLVQATPENIQVFNDAVAELVPDGKANLELAYEKAFEILTKYYTRRRCNETKTGCNQAIMLVTDGVANNTTELFEKYNWGVGENSMKLGVRIFTYLLGKEVTKVREIQWMACDNRGYYSHVRTLDEVHEEVLKYVDVIATPLVLQNTLHPPTWTHAFADKAYDQEENDAIPRLMIAVGVPAFDRSWTSVNATSQKERRARLLGVAGTDVPVEDIDKLTLPYKLGVNGYSFVISNNGYVLLHPDLRPMQDKILKNNYNSIDLTEVEQFKVDGGPRQPSDILLQLRQSMVNHEMGSFPNITVKFHYDKMRRVSLQNQTYFYGPLPNTPFSLGLVIPSGYGSTWIKVGDQVEQNIFMNINISNFFVGENWKIRPDWVYCKYHYLEGHEFKTPEEELQHFLIKMSLPRWEWHEQYEADTKSSNSNDDEPNCGRKTFGDDAYYCNRELVQLLIFDAKVTNSSYGTWKFTSNYERELIQKYNATLRFVATMSGLTRWQFIFGEVEVEDDQEFGDFHKLAIDETWYRSAILQHAIDPESFVYSVPHAADIQDDGEDLKITATHAIFHRDGGKEAPASVVGFQFSRNSTWERFKEITSKVECNGCIETCNHHLVDCFVLDNNGYIVLSETYSDTGKFFGEVNGAVMEEMVQKDIFESITVYDFQAVCKEEHPVQVDDANTLMTTAQWAIFGINWLMTELLFYFARIRLWVMAIPYDYVDIPDIPDYQDIGHGPTKKPIKSSIAGVGGKKRVQKPPPPDTYKPCDKESHLFVLNQDIFIKGTAFNEVIQTNCSHPFHVKRIPKSNLLLVVVRAISSACSITVSAAPQLVEFEQEFPCYKLNLSFLERRRLEECFTNHENESLHTYCGRAASIHYDLKIIILFLFFAIFVLERCTFAVL